MLKISVVGAGGMAEEHIKVLRSLPDVEISGIFSRTKTRAKNLAERYGIGLVAESIEDLFEKTGANGLIVAVSEVSCESILTEAIKFPWKIFSEKPIGLSMGSTKRINALRKSYSAEIFVAMNRRSFPSTEAALIEVGSVVGKRVVTIIDQEDPISAMQSGRDQEVTDKWHFANSIHLIDLFFKFCRGNVTKVENLIPWRDGYEAKVTHSIICFESGDIGIYHSIWNAPGPWSLSVELPTKRLEMRPLENLTLQNYPKRDTVQIIQHDKSHKFKCGFLTQMNSFCHFLKSGEDGELVSLNQYLRSVELTEKLYETVVH